MESDSAGSTSGGKDTGIDLSIRLLLSGSNPPGPASIPAFIVPRPADRVTPGCERAGWIMVRGRVRPVLPERLADRDHPSSAPDLVISVRKRGSSTGPAHRRRCRSRVLTPGVVAPRAAAQPHQA